MSGSQAFYHRATENTEKKLKKLREFRVSVVFWIFQADFARCVFDTVFSLYLANTFFVKNFAFFALSAVKICGDVTFEFH
jgi:hypothetical protein